MCRFIERDRCNRDIAQPKKRKSERRCAAGRLAVQYRAEPGRLDLERRQRLDDLHGPGRGQRILHCAAKQNHYMACKTKKREIKYIEPVKADTQFKEKAVKLRLQVTCGGRSKPKESMMKAE